MKIAIIGAGYVGLTCGACLAEIGHHVVCIEADGDRVERLNAGDVPIYEPGLGELVTSNRRAGRLRFTQDMAAVRSARAVFLAVGTPSAPDGTIDLSFIEAAACNIAPYLAPDALVVVKSTVVAGTARRIRDTIAACRNGDGVAVASNPEFLREGSAISDFLEADRIVIGADDETSRAQLQRIYRPLRQRGIPAVETTTTNAELIKYAANAFLALKIGFINDVADLCAAVDGDVGVVSAGIGLDRRIGQAFLSPGPGYGGSCFPKDTEAFAALGRQQDAPQHLIETLIVSNEGRKRSLAERALRHLDGAGSGSRVAILGAAFKAGTDDMRGSAACVFVPLLVEAGYSVTVHDPEANAAAAALLPEAAFSDCPYKACQGADATFILTEWEAFRTLDLGRIATAMRGRTIFDYRNLFDPADVTCHDLDYLSVGRAPALAQAGHGRPETRRRIA